MAVRAFKASPKRVASSRLRERYRKVQPRIGTGHNRDASGLGRGFLH